VVIYAAVRFPSDFHSIILCSNWTRTRAALAMSPIRLGLAVTFCRWSALGEQREAAFAEAAQRPVQGIAGPAVSLLPAR
jgi:hypothetical protein